MSNDDKLELFVEFLSASPDKKNPKVTLSYYRVYGTKQAIDLYQQRQNSQGGLWAREGFPMWITRFGGPKTGLLVMTQRTDGTWSTRIDDREQKRMMALANTAQSNGDSFASEFYMKQAMNAGVEIPQSLKNIKWGATIDVAPDEQQAAEITGPLDDLDAG